MNKTVADGNKFLIAGSFGYQNGALQIARRNPNVSVLHASGFKVAPNFSPFAAQVLPGHLSDGHGCRSGLSQDRQARFGVGLSPFPELITSINAFTLGAQAVNPDIEVSVVWLNTWFDPAKAQEATKALVATGLRCDLLQRAGHAVGDLGL
jgi:basic membrane protein A